MSADSNSDDDGSIESDDEPTVSVESLLWHYCDNDSKCVQFECSDLSARYVKNEHENNLAEFLNRHYSNDIYSNLERIFIDAGYDPDLVCFILLHFVTNYSHSMHYFGLANCNISELFMHDVFSRYIVNNKNNDVVSLNREIKFYKPSIITPILRNNKTHAAIEKCSFFTSWDLAKFACTADLVFILNALAQNVYIQSLKVFHCYDEMVIDSITRIVTCSNKLTKLELGLNEETIKSKRAWTGLVDALISSKVITDLAFESFCFDNGGLFLEFQRLLRNKANIRTLRLEAMTFFIHGQLFFNASDFSNILQINISNNKNYLRELDFDFTLMDYEESSTQSILFFKLIKDSSIEKLTIRGNDGFDYSILYDELFVNTIPFMSRLSHFNCSGADDKLCISFLNSFVKSIGQCGRYLVEATTPEHPLSMNYNIEARIKKIINRNVQLTDCIKNKTKFCRSAWPKIFSTIKVTGPDATFHFLCNLDHSVGPDQSFFIGSSKTTTEQNKRKVL